MNYAEGSLLVATWDDAGTRHAPAKVVENKIGIETTKRKERFVVGRMTVILYPSLEPPREVVLKPDADQEPYALVGPRDTRYDLREPNPRERETCERVLAQAAKVAKVVQERPKRALPEAFKARIAARKGTGAADKAIEAMRGRNGATIAQIIALTAWKEPSVRGWVSGLRSKGMKVETGKDGSGKLIYRIPE